MASALLRAGRRVDLQWGARGSWRARAQAGEFDAKVLEEVTGAKATDAALKAKRIWFCMSPDFDVYPIAKDQAMITGVEEFDSSNT
eukprot:1699335-Pyramimonas_sp.AAC.1